jgi:mRNA interferase RelE/StbE
VSWEYEVTEEAQQQLRELGKSVAGEVKQFLETRTKGCADPMQFGKPLRGNKHGFLRYRVRDWRILCRIEKKVMIVVVVAVGHRSTAYD